MIHRWLDFKAIHNSRLDWIDYAKGIAIVLVVYRHVLIGLQLAGLEISESYYNLVNEVGVTARMPLFFLLSGFFYFKSVNKRSQWGYFSHKFKSIMYPYFVWSFIQMTLQIILSNYTNESHTLSGYLLILYKPRGQFWFLYALFNVSVLYLVLDTFLKRKRILLLVTGFQMYCVTPYLNAGPLVYEIFRLFAFFALGDIMSKYVFDHRVINFFSKTYVLLLLLTISVLGEFYLYNYQEPIHVSFFLAIVGAFSLISLSILLANFNNKKLDIIRIIGYHSLYIFLLHALTSAATRILLVHILHFTDTVILHIVGTAVGIIAPILIYSIANKYNLNFLFYPPTLNLKLTSTSKS